MNLMDTKHISINDYTYELPPGKIAQYPLTERDASKLLVYHHQTIQQSTYANIAEYLPHNSLLVFNNTKVVAARLLFQKTTGATIEIFCLEPDSRYTDITGAMSQKNHVYWHCLVGGAAKWKEGIVLEKTYEQENLCVTLKATITERKPGTFLIYFEWSEPEYCFAEILALFGNVPIPPYLQRNAADSDKERYQTIYAQYEGSVAAPTAGLHFTDAIFNTLHQKNIAAAFVTLHVGAGTFKPVSAKTIEDHDMHTEWLEVHKTAIEQFIQFNGNIFAVGTTSLRTLETIYWLGVKCILTPAISMQDMFITQWEVYEHLSQAAVPVPDALAALLLWMEGNKIEKIITTTKILIAPGYHIKMVKGIITNFHQPQSTLLLLVAALIGTDWKRIYTHALENDFRFLSYGDGCLLIP